MRLVDHNAVLEKHQQPAIIYGYDGYVMLILKKWVMIHYRLIILVDYLLHDHYIQTTILYTFVNRLPRSHDI